MAGIPSIVYGFFGLVVIVPIMQKLMGGSGKSVLTASILLGIMILPTVIGVAESSIRAVPDSYYAHDIRFFISTPIIKNKKLSFQLY